MRTPVDLIDAKIALRIDSDDSDTDLQLKLDTAFELVVAYLKSGAEVFLDSSDNVIPGQVPARVKQATILLTGYLYRSPDADKDGDFELGFLPKPVIALLYQMRDPALA